MTFNSIRFTTTTAGNGLAKHSPANFEGNYKFGIGLLKKRFSFLWKCQ